MPFHLSSPTSSSLPWHRKKCRPIKSAFPQIDADSFEFFLPYVNITRGDLPTYLKRENKHAGNFDKIAFIIGEREWTIQYLVDLDGTLFPLEEALALQMDKDVWPIHMQSSGHSVLRTPATFSQHEAEEAAMDICWLLHLALGQRVAWAEMRLRSGTKSQFLCHRSFSLPKHQSKTTPLYNNRNGVLKTFLEAGYPVLRSNPNWWRITLNWYSTAAEMMAVEASGMIYCMMFDRISTYILNKYEFPKQIGTDLAETLADEEKVQSLAGKLQEVFVPLAKNWEDWRTIDLIKKVTEWNNEPSYPKKIASAYGQFGLKAPLSKLLGRRHKLVHNGSLGLEAGQAVEFYHDIHIQILVLLFGMLHFQGTFFVAGRGENKMGDFALPNAEAKE